jgi:hypothetical protein
MLQTAPGGRNVGTYLMMFGLLGMMALAWLAHADPVAAALDWRMLVPIFLIYGRSG